MSSIIRGSDNFDSIYQVSELEVIDLIDSYREFIRLNEGETDGI